MPKYDYLIIGGGIAGVTAAETIRENDPRSSIAIISEESYPLYSRVMLPAYLKKKIARERLFLRKADDFLEKKIDLHLKEKVSFADFRKKEVGLANRTIFGYEKLLIASGGRASEWGQRQLLGVDGRKASLFAESPSTDSASRASVNEDDPWAFASGKRFSEPSSASVKNFPGVRRGDEQSEKQEFIYRLQTLDDADRLSKALVETKQPLVVGASFISLEFLEIFVVNGIIPAVLIRNNHFLEHILDPVGGEILRSNLEHYGIRVQFNDSVAEINKNTGEKLEITTKALRKIECDILALGTGIERNIEFLKSSGVELGEKGIRANEFLETSEAGVYAAGDVAEFYDLVLGIHHVVGNWTNAFLQGKRAGLNMLGERAPFKNITGYSITNLGLQITALGYLGKPSNTTLAVPTEVGTITKVSEVDIQGKELETIVRADQTANQYERFFIKDGILVGASLINRFKDKPHLARLIENKVRVEEYKDKLRDFTFDINSIQA